MHSDSANYHQRRTAAVRSLLGAVYFHLQFLIPILGLAVGVVFRVLRFALPLLGKGPFTTIGVACLK